MIDLLCLIEFYNTYEHDNVFFKVCEKMLDDFDTIGDMGMQELADHLFISTSTLYRFVKMMAYDNHTQMRAGHQMFLEQYMHNGRYADKKTAKQSSLRDYSTYLCHRIESFSEEIKEENVQQMTELLLDASEIIFIGMPMPSAVWRLQIELILLGKKTSAFLNPQHQIDAMKLASKDALILMVQYMPENAAFYLQIAKEAKELGLRTAAISNIPISPTLKHVDHAITFDGELSESDMFLIEILLNTIGSQLNQKVLETKRSGQDSF